MNSITLPRWIVQQALEVLQEYAPQHGQPDDMMAVLFALRSALAQQAKPVQEPVAWECKAGGLNRLTQRQYDVQPDRIKRHYTRTAPLQRDELLQALQTLVHVCQRMDLKHQAERPSEAEYQAAMQAAQAAIQALKGGA